MNRNEKCRCGSGLKYKHCHAKIDAASPENRVSVAHKLYSGLWKHNADSLKQQGVYAWLASLLAPYMPKRIIDIGTGRGEGLQAVVKAFPDLERIISVEENEECINDAENALKATGIQVSTIRRLAHLPYGTGHAIVPEEGKLVLSGKVNIVAGDLLFDDELIAALSSGPKFDAMTVWFIGSHYLRQECENLRPLRIRSSVEYRLHVQNKAYELADVILRSGGVLQIADRGAALDGGAGEEALRKVHLDQASVTSMRVIDLQHRRYRENSNEQRVVMVATKGHASVNTTAVDTAVLSIISIKA